MVAEFPEGIVEYRDHYGMRNMVAGKLGSVQQIHRKQSDFKNIHLHKIHQRAV